MKKLLVIKQKGTTLTLSVIENSEIIKNCVPILWFNNGLYGWILTPIVKNAISFYKDTIKNSLIPNKPGKLVFSWNQTIGLLPEIGKILMSFAESENQSNNQSSNNGD